MASGGRNTILTVSAGILLLSFVIVVLFVIFPGTDGNGGPSSVNATNATPATSASPTVEKMSKIGDFNVDDENYKDSDGLTASQKNAAVLQVLSSERLNESMSDLYSGTDYNKTIGKVTLLEQRVNLGAPGMEGGFLGMNATTAAVPVVFASKGPDYHSDLFYVDLTGDRVLGFEEYQPKYARSASTIIPKNTLWYFKLVRHSNMSDNNRSELHLGIEWNASDSDVLYPVILSEENFQSFKNGSAPQPEDLTSAVTNVKITFDGLKPISPTLVDNGRALWRDTIMINRSVPAGAFSANDYYIVLKNEDENRDVKVNLIMYFL